MGVKISSVRRFENVEGSSKRPSNSQIERTVLESHPAFRSTLLAYVGERHKLPVGNDWGGRQVAVRISGLRNPRNYTGHPCGVRPDVVVASTRTSTLKRRTATKQWQGHPRIRLPGALRAISAGVSVSELVPG